MLRRNALFLLLAVMLMIVPIAAAQDGGEIPFNEQVVGEITNDVYEIAYKFSGKAGDVVVIEMQGLDILDGLSAVVLRLLDPSGNVLYDTEDTFNISTARIVPVLPEDGSYTIIAARELGAEGEEVGEFSLELIQPIPLTADSAISDSISSEGRAHYYVVQSSTPFGIGYDKNGGDFSPQVGVNVLDTEDGDLDEVAVMGGGSFTSGTIGVFEADTLYIIAVEESLFSFSFGEITADYTVSFIVAE